MMMMMMGMMLPINSCRRGLIWTNSMSRGLKLIYYPCTCFKALTNIRIKQVMLFLFQVMIFLFQPFSLRPIWTKVKLNHDWMDISTDLYLSPCCCCAATSPSYRSVSSIGWTLLLLCFTAADCLLVSSGIPHLLRELYAVWLQSCCGQLSCWGTSGILRMTRWCDVESEHLISIDHNLWLL